MIGRLNHVAIAVPDLDAASAMYRDTLGADVGAPQDEPDHGVTVVFITLPNTKIELLYPLGADSPINGFLAKNPSGGIHHVCYEVDDILAARDRLKAQGARVLVGGRRHPCGGLFFEPTVLVGATPSMQIAREETFGPVAPIFSFESEEEVVALANATEFGLAAYFFSRDVGRVFRVARALEAGMVAVNAGAFSNEVAPFGGVKQSGLGREGARHGMDEYLEIKYVTMAGLR